MSGQIIYSTKSTHSYLLINIATINRKCTQKSNLHQINLQLSVGDNITTKQIHKPHLQSSL